MITILILLIILTAAVYGCFIFLITPELIYKVLGIFSVGVPKVLIYTIKQYYLDHKISIKSLKKVYIRSFILSHVRWLIYIICIPLIYPYIHDFIDLIFTLFPPIIVFSIHIVSVFNLNIGPLYVTPNTPTPSITMQLATMTHYIEIWLGRLDSLNLRFEKQFDKAVASRSLEDIALARTYKNEMSVLRETLISRIEERRLLAARAPVRYHGGNFTDILPSKENALSMSYTYLNVDV